VKRRIGLAPRGRPSGNGSGRKNKDMRNVTSGGPRAVVARLVRGNLLDRPGPFRARTPQRPWYSEPNENGPKAGPGKLPVS